MTPDEILGARDRFGNRADDPVVFFLSEIAAQLAEHNACQKEYVRSTQVAEEQDRQLYQAQQMEGKQAAQACTSALETLANMVRVAGIEMDGSSPPFRLRRPRH